MPNHYPTRGRREGNSLNGPRSVTGIAVAQLRARIITGALTMGSHVHEQALADELGVGRAALREALRTLERDGLIVSLPRSGSRIVTLTLEDAYGIVLVREHLEELAIRHGVPGATPAALDTLRAAVQAMHHHAERPAEHSAALDGVAFHQAFIAMAGNPHLDAAFSAIAFPLGILMNLNRQVSADTESLRERADRHGRLVDLVAAGDPEAVRAELRLHQTTAFLAAGVLSEEGASSAARRWAHPTE